MGKKRKKRHGEINCTCGAYKFPHRLLGGRCSGWSWVSDFFDDNTWGECRDCRYFSTDEGFECEVCNGQESAHECPAFAEYLDREEVPVPKKLRRVRWS